MPGNSEILLRRQKVLGDFGDFALQCENLDEVLTEACRLVAEALGTRRAKVLEIEPGGKSLLVRAGVGWQPTIVGQMSIPMGKRSSESYSIGKREPVISQDISQDERFELPDFMKKEDVVALANVPILLPGAAAVFGWSAQEAVGQPGAVLFTPEDRAVAQPEKEIQTARRQGSAPNVRWHMRKDGSRVFIEGTVRALYDVHGEPEGFLKIGRDATERRNADERLRASEARFRSLAGLVPALLWQMDASGRNVTLNQSWLDYTGQTDKGTQNQGWLDAVHPQDRAETERLLAEAIGSGEPLEHQHRMRGRDGQYRWFLFRQMPWRDAQGRIAAWFGAAADIHEMRKLQERQAVLVGELQHRTRNLIGVVRSIATQTMAQTGPTEAFREEFNHRLAALSRVQGLLSQAESNVITLRTLLELEFDALGATEGERVKLDGPSVRVRSSIVQTLALALHELATNARKYGALSEGGGRLSVEWHLRDSADGRQLFIDWREEGLSPKTAAPLRSEAGGGYGRRLVERALPMP